MSKWFKENGFLSDEGKKALAGLKETLEGVLASPEGRDLTDNELQALQANVANMVGNLFSNTLQARSEESKMLDRMTDEQFELYLFEKYGDNWMLVSLTKQEQIRSSAAFARRIEKAFAEAYEIRQAVIANTPQINIDPNLRFK